MASARVRRWRAGATHEVDDLVAIEEPLEVHAGRVPIVVIMRTPGNDDELAVGFLHTEGIVRERADVEHIGYWRDADGGFSQNTVTVTLRDGVEVGTNRQRQFFASSSCGVCGKASISAAMALGEPLGTRATLRPSVLYGLPEKLRVAQRVFDRTGGLHAAALFDMDGNMLAVREDVGRHNAVDKLVGRGFLAGSLPFRDCLLLVSGRVSFEIVQKALVARIPLIAGISAPSSLAVQAARQANIVLVGFLRDGRLNEY
jgi:FdhD protein